MKKIIFFAIALLVIFSCTETNKTVTYALDNPAERIVWERIRLADPNTGEIPRNIRKKEMMFGKLLLHASGVKSTTLSFRQESQQDSRLVMYRSSFQCQVQPECFG